MATTGISNFSVTRDDVIKAALRGLTELGAGEVPSTEDYTNCSQAINMMLKDWQKKGAALWLYQELSLPLITGVQTYPIGPTAGSLATAACVITAAGTGGTTGTYTLGIADAGGGTGATGTYTIAGGSLTAITITAAGNSYVTPVLSFPSGSLVAAAATATPVGLTATKPLRVLDAFVRDANDYDTSLIVISRTEFDILGAKDQTGIPNQLYVNPQLSAMQVSFYNSPVDSTRTAHLIVQRPIYDMSAAGDTFDLPQEWYRAIKWGLMDELALEYGVEEKNLQLIMVKAEKYLTECFDFSVEEPSLYFTVDSTQR